MRSPKRLSELRLEFLRKGMSWALHEASDEDITAEEAIRLFLITQASIIRVHEAMQKVEAEIREHK